jgi:hypothetical protein
MLPWKIQSVVVVVRVWRQRFDDKPRRRTSMTTLPVTTPDVKAIETLLGTYERSLNTADAELAASLYAPDGMFMPLFLPTAEGSEILGR